MIVPPHVREVRRHAVDRARAPQLEERAVAGRVELQQRRSELEPLRPLRPPARAIAPFGRKDRRAVFGPPSRFERLDLRGGQRERAIDAGQQVPRRSPPVDPDHFLAP